MTRIVDSPRDQALDERCSEGGGMDKVTCKVLEIVRDRVSAAFSPDE